jgi:hypothetical protein
MKRIVMMMAAGATLLGSGIARADGDDWHPRCRIQGIEQQLNGAITEIKQSPAMGHAGGHYGHAIEDIEKVKRQLREGCRAWMRDHHDRD